MNRFLYKYMRVRSDFFENPVLRATPFRALNDPFEGHFNSNQISNTMSNMGQDTSQMPDGISIEDIMHFIDIDFKSSGIISLTEDHTNLLMWSHYADEHRGMVIEFDLNEPLYADSIREINGKKSRFIETSLGDIFEYPQKVMYRNIMPIFDRKEFSVPEDENEYPWKKLIETLYFTKANDWIYEKEHRSVVRLSDADIIICDYDDNVIKECAKDSSITVETLTNKKIRIEYPNLYEMSENMGDESIKSEIDLLTTYNHEPPLHFYRLNPKAISAIYFGYNCDYKKYIKCINDNPKLSHLKENIYKMRKDDFQYRLVTERIYL